MKFVLNNLFKVRLICFVLFCSCLTTNSSIQDESIQNQSIQDSNISDLVEKKKEAVIISDNNIINESKFKRDYLIGLKDNESFFLSNAFLKENNFILKKPEKVMLRKILV